jgi:hypothetical protein
MHHWGHAQFQQLSLTVFRSKHVKEMMEHVTQYPEEYSKVASVQKKV